MASAQRPNAILRSERMARPTAYGLLGGALAYTKQSRLGLKLSVYGGTANANDRIR